MKGFGKIPLDVASGVLAIDFFQGNVKTWTYLRLREGYYTYIRVLYCVLDIFGLSLELTH